MGLVHKDTFICLDCEATGLEIKTDQIIELAAVRFNFEESLDSYETLVNPECLIPEISSQIHHITDEMVRGKPTIKEVLPEFLDFIKGHIIVGHGIQFDLDLLTTSANKHQIPATLHQQRSIDTLRLARLYGESPINSLEKLREHFNLPSQGAHRAMNDVRVNIEVFKHLSQKFKTTEQIFQRLKKPISLKIMPLGKHKGRTFPEIPLEYLHWAAGQNFDQDLLFSLRSEINRRKKGNLFSQASNPFSSL